MSVKIPKGVVGVFINAGGQVLASTSDFESECKDGFTLLECQKSRVRKALCIAVLRTLTSDSLVKAMEENLEEDDFERSVRRIPGAITLIPIGHDNEQSET